MYVALRKFLHGWALSSHPWLIGRPLFPSPEVLMGFELNRLVFKNPPTRTHFQ